MNGTAKAVERQQYSVGAQFLQHYPIGGWQKWLFKAPLVPWRMGLDFLIGRSIMVITTVGRKSGLPRYTMAEWHWLDGSKFVPVNYGKRAQWYKNMRANPHVTIHLYRGSKPYSKGDEYTWVSF